MLGIMKNSKQYFLWSLANREIASKAQNAPAVNTVHTQRQLPHIQSGSIAFSIIK